MPQGDPALGIDPTYLHQVVIDTITIPEPASIVIWGLLAAAAITVGWWRRKR